MGESRARFQQIPDAALDRCDDGTIVAYLWLRRFSDWQTGELTASLATIADKGRRKLKTLKRALRKLADLGFAELRGDAGRQRWVILDESKLSDEGPAPTPAEAADGPLQGPPYGGPWRTGSKIGRGPPEAPVTGPSRGPRDGPLQGPPSKLSPTIRKPKPGADLQPDEGAASDLGSDPGSDHPSIPTKIKTESSSVTRRRPEVAAARVTIGKLSLAGIEARATQRRKEVHGRPAKPKAAPPPSVDSSPALPARSATPAKVDAAELDRDSVFAFAGRARSGKPLDDDERETACDEVERAYRAYRKACDGRDFGGHVSADMRANLANTCALEEFTPGQLLAELHRACREFTPMPIASVSFVASRANLDRAAVTARGRGSGFTPDKARAAPPRADARLGYLDKGRLDPRVVPALRAAGFKPNALSTEATWALAAQANAEAWVRKGVLARDEKTAGEARCVARVLHPELVAAAEREELS